MHRLPVDDTELGERISLNFKRLADDPYYQIEQVFQPEGCEWPGDKEGRAMLAFVSHYRISSKRIPCMDEMIRRLPEHLNDSGYLGPCGQPFIFEQQLSGHSWMLRGLCGYHEAFGDSESLKMAMAIAENLFLPLRGQIRDYPVDRTKQGGGDVSGNSFETENGWKLSTDIGCAFMSIDGLAHVYKVSRDERILELLYEMTGVFASIDKEKLRAQTHCSLTAGRGMMSLYHETGDKYFLDSAKQIFDLYISSGMTYTYQNLNWWGRPDTWTEPCAIVDSLMLALELHKATGNEAFRRTAAAIWHNGLSTSQRENGGAGTDTLVAAGSPWNHLKIRMYEAFFCCTMRLAEGLMYVNGNKDLLYATLDGSVKRNSQGIYTDGDIVYAQVEGGAEKYADYFVKVDGMRLCPIVKYYRVPRDIAENSIQRIRFN